MLLCLYLRYVDKCEDVWQSGAISWQAKGLLVEEELKYHKSEVDDIGGTAVERHQNLIERADGEYYQGQNEEKFGGGRDSPDNLHVIPHSAPPRVLETQNNSEEPEQERDNRMLEAGM